MDNITFKNDDYKINDIINNKIHSYDKEFIKELQDNLHKKLFALFISSCFFSFIPHNFTLSYNSRQTFFQAYFIKNYIVGKHFCHIGGAAGDLELLLSKYAKKITIIECNDSLSREAIEKNEKSLYGCPVEIITDTFYNTKIDADVYFTWCGQGADYNIINYILQYNDKCKIISPCIPYYYWKKYNLKNIIPDNFLIPFDENLDISYYLSRMFKNNNNIIIEHNDVIFLYECCGNNEKHDKIKLIDNIEKENFNFENYKEYQHPYLLNKLIRENDSPAAKLTSPLNFFKHRQNSLRGYITLGVLDISPKSS